MSDPIENPIVEAAQPVPAPRWRRTGWIVGLSLLGVLLLGAAFLGGRLLNGQAGPGMNLGNLIGPGGLSPAISSFKIERGEPPEELPRTAPEVSGQFSKRSDNLLSISTALAVAGTGAVSIVGEEGGHSSSGPPVMPTPSGPFVEVVVTRDTKIYRDSTFDDLKGGMPDPNQTIQQKVAEATLDEIGASSFVTVWGRKNGDRVIADVIMFTSPVVFTRKN